MFLKIEIKCIAHIGLHEDAYWHNLMSLNLWSIQDVPVILISKEEIQKMSE